MWLIVAGLEAESADPFKEINEEISAALPKTEARRLSPEPCPEKSSRHLEAT